ncbi:MAG: hypothetical protein KDC99_19850, partial [Cyclobacteriaceae bacterium]|nr:hypothetical protein [Cyclobacteriaceae bacterium]
LIRLKNGNKVVENCFWLEGEVSSEDPLTYDYLNPEGLKTFEDFSNSLGGTRKLTDLVDFVGTYQYAIFKSGVIETEEDYDFHVPEGYAGILDAKGLSVTGDIDIRSIHKSILIDYIRKDSLIRKGDILIRQINNFEQQETLFVAIVDDLPSPLIASNSIIVLRPKAGVAPTQLKLLISFLKGRHTLERIKAHGSRFHLSRSILERFSVPEPDLAISEAIESLDAAEKAHIDWIKELSQVRDEIFSIPDSREKRLRLLSETRRVRQKYAAANTVDDFASRVRRYFPHPIAYRWTMIETRERDYEGYKHILECTEVTIAYLASIGILLAKKYGKVITVVRDEATKLGRNNTHGKTFGYWIKVLEDVRSLLRDADQSIPFYEITRFPKTFADDQLGLNAERAISYLTKSRNSDAHFQGPKGFEVQSVYQEAYDKLQLVLQGAEFLTEYPLIYIEKTRLDTLTNLTHYQYRELMGDQHLVPIHNKVSTRTDLEAESLYLQDREGELHCLRPMLLSRAAAKENRRATFYLNQYSPQENTCTLRSLELGDTVFDLDVSQYVQSGLITPEQKT